MSQPVREWRMGPNEYSELQEKSAVRKIVNKEKHMENEVPSDKPNPIPLPKPSVGRIVLFHFQASDANLNNGLLVAPAIITAVWSDTCVNLKVLADNPHDQWKTSMSLGEGPGQWSWPPRV
jgi:hypothetical protein